MEKGKKNSAPAVETPAVETPAVETPAVETPEQLEAQRRAEQSKRDRDAITHNRDAAANALRLAKAKSIVADIRTNDGKKPVTFTPGLAKLAATSLRELADVCEQFGALDNVKDSHGNSTRAIQTNLTAIWFGKGALVADLERIANSK